MASESKRGCGYRKVGKIYLVGSWRARGCDRLPVRLHVCPTCGAGIKQARAWNRVIPLSLFGLHLDEGKCNCPPNCWMCYPPEEDHHAIMWVGTRYYKTPDDFSMEAAKLGVSKAVPTMPKWFKIGESIVYLAHPKAVMTMEHVDPGEPDGDLFPVDAVEVKWEPGIFMVWKPERIEKLFWESDKDSDEVERWEKRGGTSVFIPDGDMDHDRSTPLLPKEEPEPIG